MIVGVDVGGTFTDVALWDGERLHTAKLPTTTDQSEGVVAGVIEVAPGGVAELLHGTTVATNALLERSGAVTGLVTDAGFEDILEIGRQDRPSLYDPWADRPRPLVPRERRVGVAGDRPIDPDAFAGCDAVAVCLLWSYEDPSREREVARVLAGAGDLTVVLSSEVSPEFREFERTSTTVVNAYLTPIVAGYLQRLLRRVEDVAGVVAVMRSSGGLLDVAEAARLPAAILLSGPAAGVVAASVSGTLLGYDEVVSFDMGGTSTDVCRVVEGHPEIGYERAVAGYPVRMPSAAIHTVGAGGGSIGWLDPGGSLRVGPRSAGAEPGPACYARGGTEPTVTDAHVVLGRIAADVALGGRLRVDATLARRALGRLAEALGGEVETTALGVVRVVEEVMAGAVRTVSVEQGADPRAAALVAFGGAGGLHATALARTLEMAGAVIPPHGGVLSALGLLLSPPRVDLVRGTLLAAGQARLDQLTDAIAGEAARRLPGGRVATRVDARYRGQAHELTVPYAAGEGWRVLEERFHALHRARNGFARPDDPVEVTAVRAEAVGRPALTVDDLPLWNGDGDARRGGREVLTIDGPVTATVWRREGLRPGDRVEGPAVVEEPEATTWIGPGEMALVHPSGALEVVW